jgi:carbonic anhydrase/acetyltransferase-like protein (isoleucine patch superfamily)
VLRSFNGKSPRVHPTAFVSEAAYVVGDVEIGPYSSVWPGTIIRGDHHKIVLGAYVDMQDNCVVHTDSDAHYGDYVSLGHHVICHAKTVSSNCLIGNGAVVNGEVEIGEYSIVAAGSLVLERVVIAPHSFVTGAPAALLRPTEERHHQMIRGIAESYARNGQDFKEAGLGDVPEEFLMRDASTDFAAPPPRTR